VPRAGAHGDQKATVEPPILTAGIPSTFP